MERGQDGGSGVTAGPAGPGGDGCLAAAAITQPGGQAPFSRLIYCRLRRGEARALNFKGSRSEALEPSRGGGGRPQQPQKFLLWGVPGPGVAAR